MAGIIKTNDGYVYIDRAGKQVGSAYPTKGEAKVAHPDLYEKEADVNPGGNPSIGEKPKKKLARKVAKKTTKK